MDHTSETRCILLEDLTELSGDRGEKEEGEREE
jgi:hypothetical protein